MTKKYKFKIDRYTYRAKAYGYKRSKAYYQTTKFRWYYGDIRHLNDGTIGMYFWDDYLYDFYHIVIEPDTICQCTGLLDSNGDPIFEHDIIRVPQTNKEDEEVIFDNGSFLIGDGFGYYNLFESIQSNRKHDIKYYVQSNSFDNPEFTTRYGVNCNLFNKEEHAKD